MVFWWSLEYKWSKCHIAVTESGLYAISATNGTLILTDQIIVPLLSTLEEVHPPNDIFIDDGGNDDLAIIDLTSSENQI